MPCYEPLHGFVVGLTDEKKSKLLVTSGKVKAISTRTHEPCYFDVSSEETDYQKPAFELPCGHCLGCREDQAREWSNRLLMESKYHDSAYFLTLTYDDSCVPYVQFLDEETGEFFWHSNLSKRDGQLFVKRLRRAFPNDKIRYYLVGEYGDSTDRAHMHGIFFGLHLSDLQFHGLSKTGHEQYTSEKLDSVWRNGYVTVEQANEHTFKYVCSYVTKKIGIYPNAVYEVKGLQPPFATMSLKPGIGYQYLHDNRGDIAYYDNIVIGNSNGSFQMAPPRYWYKKLNDWSYSKDAMEFYSDEKRNNAIDRKETELSRTDLDYISYLEVKKAAHERKLKKRDGV